MYLTDMPELKEINVVLSSLTNKWIKHYFRCNAVEENILKTKGMFV